MTDKDRTAICNIVSEMLDSPDKSGIYPTTVCYEKLEQLIEEARTEALGWMHADCCVTLDNGDDPRRMDMADMLNRANRDLSKEHEEESSK